MKIIVTGDTVPPRLKDYCHSVEIDVELLNGVNTPAEIKLAIADADYYLLGGDEYLSKEILENAAVLQSISFLGTGPESFVDVDVARARGVTVLTTPGANAGTVAEFAVGQVLGIRRRILSDIAGTSAVTRDSAELRESTVGILGLGAVGTELARILRNGFGCEVSYSSRTRKPEIEKELGIQKLGLRELFERSSTVFICCSLTESTEGLIGAALLQAGVDYVVSIADPRVFVLSELAESLAQGHLLCVALDGDYTQYPDISADSLRLLDLQRNSKLFVTQHIAASSDRAWFRMRERAVDNLINAIGSKVR